MPLGHVILLTGQSPPTVRSSPRPHENNWPLSLDSLLAQGRGPEISKFKLVYKIPHRHVPVTTPSRIFIKRSASLRGVLHLQFHIRTILIGRPGDHITRSRSHRASVYALLRTLLPGTASSINCPLSLSLTSIPFLSLPSLSSIRIPNCLRLPSSLSLNPNPNFRRSRSK